MKRSVEKPKGDNESKWRYQETHVVRTIMVTLKQPVNI